MADYDYRVIDGSGREQRGRVPAASEDAARSELKRRSLYVVSIEESAAGAAPQAALLSASRWRARAMSSKQLSLFTRQLATLVQVTPLEESLRTIALQSEQSHVRDAISSVHLGVFEGRRLADAMAREPRSFPSLFRATIAAGENTGTLPQILERLSELLERQAVIRSKIISAVAYPVVLTIVALAVVAALMIVVVPKVVEQFDTIGQQLPLVTRIVIAVSGFLSSWWLLLLAGLFGAVLVSGVALRNPATRLRFDGWLLRVPGLGRLIRDLNAARVARTLATMVASRLPLYEGLSLTAQTVNNRALRKATEDIAESIRGGSSLSAGLKRTGMFPPLLVYLAASGESAGQLDTMLERAADYLEREFDTFTATLLSMLEPAIIIAMGIIVATIVLSILLPILQLESLAGT